MTRRRQLDAKKWGGHFPGKSRGRIFEVVGMTVIDEPAVAVAIGHCLTARSLADRRGAITTQHPRPCAWCDFPLEYLDQLVKGFLAWAEPKDQGGATVYGRFDANRFAELARHDPETALAQVRAAQELVEEAPGVGGSDPRGSSPTEDRFAALFWVDRVQTSKARAFQTRHPHGR